jgi:hypothetical protein
MHKHQSVLLVNPLGQQCAQVVCQPYNCIGTSQICRDMTNQLSCCCGTSNISGLQCLGKHRAAISHLCMSPLDDQEVPGWSPCLLWSTAQGQRHAGHPHCTKTHSCSAVSALLLQQRVVATVAQPQQLLPGQCSDIGQCTRALLDCVLQGL